MVYGKAVARLEDVIDVDDAKFGPNGGFTSVLSTPSQDRDGDRLLRKEWLDLEDRYPLDMDHGMSVADTIGSFHPYFDGEKMMMDAYFASTAQAQDVRTLVKEGHIRSVSVAFMVDKTKKDGEPRRELLNAGVVAIPSNRDAVILASKAAHALRDALSEESQGEVPAEVKKAVLDILTVQKNVDEPDEVDEPNEQDKAAGIIVDVIPQLDEDALKRVVEKIVEKAASPGGDAAMVQAIHDASSHLGACCVVPLVTDEDPTGSAEGANKSADVVEDEKFFELEDIRPEGMDMEQFKSALQECLHREESPAAPVPADEAPTPAAPDVNVVTRAQMLRMQMSLRSIDHITEGE